MKTRWELLCVHGSIGDRGFSARPNCNSGHRRGCRAFPLHGSLISFSHMESREGIIMKNRVRGSRADRGYLRRGGRGAVPARGDECLGRGISARRCDRAACRSASRRRRPTRSSSTSGAVPRSTWKSRPDGFWTVTTTPLVPGPALLRDQRRRRRRQRPRQPARSSAASRYVSAVEIPGARLDLLLHPGRAARAGARGVVRLEGHRLAGATPGLSAARTTNRSRRSVIRCSICSTAAARMKPAGSARDARTSFSTT